MHKGWCCCGIVTSLVVLGVIIFCALVFPERTVDYAIVKTTVDKNNVHFGSWGMTVPVWVKLLFINENYYDICLRTLNIIGTHPLYHGALIHGNLTNVMLYKRSDQSGATLVAFVDYKFVNDPNRAYIEALSQNCSSTDGKLWTFLSVRADYSMFLQDGVRHFDRPFEIPCATITSMTGTG